MKRVFSSINKTIHTWYRQDQETGRNGRGNVFFEGSIIYSYGKHFPMANFIDWNFLLMNCKNYSTTTQCHKGRVYCISKAETIIKIPDIVNPKNPENINYLKKEIQNHAKRVKNSLFFKAWAFERLIVKIEDYQKFCNKFYNTDYKLIDLHSYLVNNIYTNYQDKDKETRAEQQSRIINRVLIPKKYWKRYQNNTLKPKDIFSCRNAQVRAELLNKYTYERLLMNTENVIIDTDKEKQYQLIKIVTPQLTTFQERTDQGWREVKAQEDIYLLKVRCPSTGIFYVLRVPPTMQRVKEALAWTFNIPENVYNLEMET
jgi:hypothetical protein